MGEGEGFQESPGYVEVNPRKSRFCLENLIESSASDAKRVLEQHEAANWDANWGDEESCVRDAKQILSLIRFLERGKLDRAALAYWLGRFTERLEVRPFEPITKTGKKTKSSLGRGPETRKKKAAERRKQQRRDAEKAMSEARKSLRDEGKAPEQFKDLAVKRAGKILGIAPRSVRERLKKGGE
ncbi:MAG: hypothetical protein O3C40_09745 [Planctomycetota bacterium]|nr:hypothetical protein [Planctomycetota bacterium]